MHGAGASEIYLLPAKVQWFGAHSGYGCLTQYLQKADQPPKITVFEPTARWVDRLRGKFVSSLKGFGSGPQGYIASVHRLASQLKGNPKAIGHVLHGEDVIPYLSLFSASALKRLVLTLHQPRALWTREMLAALRSVKHCVLLYSRDLEFFKQHVQSTPTLIKHAVDTDFFCPADSGSSQPGRILFSGVHLRDWPTLYDVVSRLNRFEPGLVFDFLVPKSHPVRQEMEARFRGLPINWLSNLNDLELRALYQRADLMLLPLKDSGANTAVIEALASGLPLATTDVGGIRDYGGGDVFPILASGDATGLFNLVCQYLENAPRRQRTSAEIRRFAQEQLSWSHCTSRHVALYQSIQ